MIVRGSLYPLFAVEKTSVVCTETWPREKLDLLRLAAGGVASAAQVWRLHVWQAWRWEADWSRRSDRGESRGFPAATVCDSKSTGIAKVFDVKNREESTEAGVRKSGKRSWSPIGVHISVAKSPR